VVNTGYFSDRFGSILERYGATVTQLRAPIGGRPTIEEVEAALKKDRFKVMTVTHVDTSTAVINDVKALAALARKYETLIVVDGVCSIAGEEFRMSEWGIDVALTASQKAIGVPPGLALLVAGPRAIEALRKRESPVMNYYADWNNWLPVLEAYEARKVGYFGTPAINLVWALNVSLDQILKEGLEARVERHRKLSRSMQAAIKALGLGQVPLNEDCAAHTLSAPRYPQGVTSAELLPRVEAAGAIIAGGLHPQIRTEYFRIGHMGSTSIGDLLATIGAVEIGLAGCGYKFEMGAGVAAAMKGYNHG
jgi:alanine-glyoxylate transaminase/serine-glyoxylate transaminase/serine-pyruvate transaminase